MLKLKLGPEIYPGHADDVHDLLPVEPARSHPARIPRRDRGSREPEITELIGRLGAGQREIFVIGPSGSGKSSLVAAGVLPRLARGLSGRRR